MLTRNNDLIFRNLTIRKTKRNKYSKQTVQYLKKVSVVNEKVISKIFFELNRYFSLDKLTMRLLTRINK